MCIAENLEGQNYTEIQSGHHMPQHDHEYLNTNITTSPCRPAAALFVLQLSYYCNIQPLSPSSFLQDTYSIPKHGKKVLKNTDSAADAASVFRLMLLN